MSTTKSEPLIQELYMQAARARDRNWEATSRALGHLLAYMEAGEELDRAFGHLVPAAPAQPLETEDYQRAIDEARGNVEPPPLPDEELAPPPPPPNQRAAAETEDEHEKAVLHWEQVFQRRHPLRGGRSMHEAEEE